MLKGFGADIDTAISKKTNFVLIGQEPGPAKMAKLDKLIHDGFPIRKLYQEDLTRILAGEYDDYRVEKAVAKDLDFTMKHYLKHHIDFVDGRNIISLKEIFFGKGLAGNVDLFYQICGNLGAAGDSHQIYPETNLILLSDSTLAKLEKGEKDATIQYIQDYYNSNKSIVFDFKFLSESDVLKFCKERCERCGDELTMDMYERYMESAYKKMTEMPKYEFKDGKNYCKVGDKYVLKLEDGRTWCPSLQFRGTSYNIKEEKKAKASSDDE